MMNFGNRFEALRSHTALVVTISEERQIHEANLKLIMARVNAATSLLKWAKGEGNPALHDTVEKLYDVSLMWSTVQKKFAEQGLHFSKSLGEILQIEQGLDAIKKQHTNTKEELEKLQKQSEGLKRKSDMAKINELQEDIIKKSAEEEELAAELQVKFVKGEIFKARVIKNALLELMDVYKDNAAKVNSLCEASKSIIEYLPDIPRHLTTDSQHENNNEASEIVAELAKELGLEDTAHCTQNRPLSEVLNRPLSNGMETSVVQATSPPPSPVLTKKEIQQEKKNEKKKKKRNSKLPSPLGSNFPITKLMNKKQKAKVKRSTSQENQNNIVAQQLHSASPPLHPRPMKPPPALPLSDFRRRSQSSNLDREKSHRKSANPVNRSPLVIPKAENNNDDVTNHDFDLEDCDDDDGDDDSYEEPGYIRPNLFGLRHPGLVRCASDSTISRISRGDDYTEPLDRYEALWDGLGLEDHLYEIPYDCMEVGKGTPPPKPERRIRAEAIYVNTDDVERILQDFYADESVKEQVKPEIKQRVFKKIAHERRASQPYVDAEENADDNDRFSANDPGRPEVKKRVFKKPPESRAVSYIDAKAGGVGELKGEASGERIFKSDGVPIAKQREKRIRSKSAQESNDIMLKSGALDGIVSELPANSSVASRGQEARVSDAQKVPGNNFRNNKPPKLPMKVSERTGPSNDKEARPVSASSYGSSPGKSDISTSPPGNNVKDLALMLKSKVPMSKAGKPMVPPKPVVSP
eukprot:gene10835-11987_t